MRLAITGGAGFLGYHLCPKLSQKTQEILVLDIAPINAGEYPPNTKYIQTDVRNLEQLNGLFQGVDAVVHAAAALPLWDRREIFEINVEGTRNVLRAAQKNRVAKVIYVSSTAVYGIPKVHPIREETPLVGVGPYGESKIAAEKICQEFWRSDMLVPIIRPKSFIGTGRMGVFQILYDWIESGKRIPMIGRGDNRYQLLEVDDLVDAIALLLSDNRPALNDWFNIGAGQFGTVREDLGALCQAAQTGARPLPTPAWPTKSLLALFEKLHLSPLYKWIYATADKDSYVSTEKIQRLLGWSSRYSNAEALIRSYRWYLEHKPELSGTTGITHRVPWKQGVLALIKKFL